MNTILRKLREVTFSIIPIVILVILLSFTAKDINLQMILKFLTGSIFIIIGLTLFLIGVDIGIVPLGSYTGTSLAKTNKLFIVLSGGFIMGFFISVAEPSLIVLSKQVSLVSLGKTPSLLMLVVVSLGLASLLTIGLYRVFYNISLKKILFVSYLLVFSLAIFSSKEFLGIAFDASGSTTGILSVPFILSLSIGISKMKKNSKKSENDSFGLIAIASAGAILSVLALDLVYKNTEFIESLDTDVALNSFISLIPKYLVEAFLAVSPLLLILFIMQKFFIKLNKRKLKKILTGFAFSFTGLVIFLVGVNGGFMRIASVLGKNFATMDNKFYIIFISLILGLITVLAEPAVYILTEQIDEVTSGTIPKKLILMSLSLGVGIAVLLSTIRILIPAVQLWHYLLPGYILCFVLMFFTPDLFVAIAFDAGGVATGPMTATFIMSFMQGAASGFDLANVAIDGFGMIAMVAMMPILTIEILGILFKLKTKRG